MDSRPPIDALSTFGLLRAKVSHLFTPIVEILGAQIGPTPVRPRLRGCLQRKAA